MLFCGLWIVSCVLCVVFYDVFCLLRGACRVLRVVRDVWCAGAVCVCVFCVLCVCVCCVYVCVCVKRDPKNGGVPLSLQMKVTEWVPSNKNTSPKVCHSENSRVCVTIRMWTPTTCKGLTWNEVVGNLTTQQSHDRSNASMNAEIVRLAFTTTDLSSPSSHVETHKHAPTL